MKWPWVSRSDYDELRGRLACEKAVSEAYQRSYDSQSELFNHVVELWSATFSSAQKPSVSSVATQDRSPSLIDQVIREQAPTDPRLKAHLRSYASKLKREGKSEGDIVLALTAWSTTEPLLTE